MRHSSQSAFVRGFIDDVMLCVGMFDVMASQSAFVRGFIDDTGSSHAAKSLVGSQSAFVRGFIDDYVCWHEGCGRDEVSIRVRARLHR